MQSQPYNTPGISDELAGYPGNSIYGQINSNLGPTPNALYNQSVPKDQQKNTSFKDWITKESKSGGKLDQAKKQYGPMFEEWAKGKFGHSSTDNTSAPTGDQSARSGADDGTPTKVAMPMWEKFAIGFAISLGVGAIAFGIYKIATRKKQ